MTTWKRAPVECRCGCCGRTIAIGAPMQTIVFTSAAKIRCETCAVGGAPELPPLAARVTGVRTVTPRLPFEFQPVSEMVDGWRMRAAGEREPGQEG